MKVPRTEHKTNEEILQIHSSIFISQKRQIRHMQQYILSDAIRYSSVLIITPLKVKEKPKIIIKLEINTHRLHGAMQYRQVP